MALMTYVRWRYRLIRMSILRIIQLSQEGIMIGAFHVGLLLALLSAATAKITLARPQLSSQYVPISKRYAGLDLPGANAAVTIEVVSDATCGSCVEFDVTMRQVQSSLESAHPGKFSYRYALQVLPYHISSLKITQAIKYVNDKQGAPAAFAVLRHFFDTNDRWVESSIAKTTIANLMDSIAREVSTLTGLPVDEVRGEVAHYSNTDRQTRKWVKYAMGTLHVSGTPTIFVNGARLDGATGMTVQQLVDLFSGLL